jgi:LmbE family N-acetylglucosaminyl deacetylase
MRALVLAPHADDETLGCGGLLARWGAECAVAVLADPGQVRGAQLGRALKHLAVTELYVGDEYDGLMLDNPVALQATVDQLVQGWQPVQLYVPSPQAHQDHQALYAAGLRSLRHSRQLLHRPRQLLAYDVPSYPWATVGTQVYQQLDARDVAAKADALDEYVDQAVPARGVVLATARAVGARVGVEYAEQYQLVHEVRP